MGYAARPSGFAAGSSLLNLFGRNDAVYLVQEHRSYFVSEQKVRKANRRFRDAVLDDRISLAVVFR